MSSYSSSSSSSAGGGGCFFLSSSFLSSGQVELSFSQGAMQSKSNRWSLWQGNSTTSGNSSIQKPGQPTPTAANVLPDSPSRNAFLQIGQRSVAFKDFFGTRSSSSRKLFGTPASSAGGLSALCWSASIMFASRSSPSASVLPWSSGVRPRIMAKAFASTRCTAATFSGCGCAWTLWCSCASDVSTSSSVEKKVPRSGRRGACAGLSSLVVGMLCSTEETSVSRLGLPRQCWKLAFVARHGCDSVGREETQAINSADDECVESRLLKLIPSRDDDAPLVPAFVWNFPPPAPRGGAAVACGVWRRSSRPTPENNAMRTRLLHHPGLKPFARRSSDRKTQQGLVWCLAWPDHLPEAIPLVHVICTWTPAPA